MQNSSKFFYVNFFMESDAVWCAESEYVWFVYSKAMSVVIKLKKLQQSKFRKTNIFWKKEPPPPLRTVLYISKIFFLNLHEKLILKM